MITTRERSSGAIIFRKEEGKIYYLLLSYPSAGKTHRIYWGFPKGHIERGESEKIAARREIAEETGLKDIIFIKHFRKLEKYFFKRGDKKIFKVVVFYLAETKTKEIKISPEHTGFKWLPYQEALRQLTFKNAKKILEKANGFIFQKKGS
jgi:8-oxo-dGTP pyrophosphatase MutT (NUDIX family)